VTRAWGALAKGVSSAEWCRKWIVQCFIGSLFKHLGSFLRKQKNARVPCGGWITEPECETVPMRSHGSEATCALSDAQCPNWQLAMREEIGVGALQACSKPASKRFQFPAMKGTEAAGSERVFESEVFSQFWKNTVVFSNTTVLYTEW
jgi:hypothetical protein